MFVFCLPLLLVFCSSALWISHTVLADEVLHMQPAGRSMREKVAGRAGRALSEALEMCWFALCSEHQPVQLRRGVNSCSAPLGSQHIMAQAPGAQINSLVSVKHLVPGTLWLMS